MKKPLELTVYPRLKRPRYGSQIDAYRAQWYGENKIAQAKRLTDPELAAEWQYQDNRTGQKCEGYGIAHDGTSMGSEEEEIEKLRTIYRFATLPHYDEDAA